MSKYWRQVNITLNMVKFEHVVFALPFAFIGSVLAARGVPSLIQCLWILLAMIGARNSAMAFNRLVDEKIDRENPRTRNRALPAGLVTRSYIIGFILFNSFLFIVAAYLLNQLSFLLSFPALALLFFYSYTKRFTSLCHLVLGTALSIAPAGGWIAISGYIDYSVLILSAVVVTWVAGFDIIYACQDVQFDSSYGLYSIPRRFGTKKALRISLLMHILTVLFLFLLYDHFQLGWVSLVGMIILSILLISEHLIIRPGDLSKINVAFFTFNGLFSVLLFLFIFIDLLIENSGHVTP